MCVGSAESEEIMIKLFTALFCIAGLTVGLAGCNTVEGMGKDVKATGESIENAAQKSKGGGGY
jgi:predicted small secreted protein